MCLSFHSTPILKFSSLSLSQTKFKHIYLFECHQTIHDEKEKMSKEAEKKTAEDLCEVRLNSSSSPLRPSSHLYFRFPKIKETKYLK